LVIVCFTGALCVRTLHRRFAVVLDMVWKQHKTAPIPQAALNALDWRIAFLVADS
jgi:hypothetical protein